MAVLDAGRRAIHMARGGAPVLLEMRTYRFRAHSMFDAQGYRDKAEVERFKARDPLTVFFAFAKGQELFDDEDVAACELRVKRVVDEAVAFAEAGTLEPVADLLKGVVAGRDGSGSAA
jgi:TPP-dependent pyruvate/acetoin dehydrogenase alpha subunit